MFRLGHGDGQLIAASSKRDKLVADHQVQRYQIHQLGGNLAVQLDVPVGKLGRHNLGQILTIDQAFFQAQLTDHLLGDVLLGEDVLEIILGHKAQFKRPVAEAELFVCLRCHISANRFRYRINLGVARRPSSLRHTPSTPHSSRLGRLDIEPIAKPSFVCRPTHDRLALIGVHL